MVTLQGLAIGIPIGVGLVGMFFRIEHRLTRIETDIAWIKRNNSKVGAVKDDKKID